MILCEKCVYCCRFVDNLYNSWCFYCDFNGIIDTPIVRCKYYHEYDFDEKGMPTYDIRGRHYDEDLTR